MLILDISTSNEMCSLPNRISSSCLPSLFFCGHLVSSSLSTDSHQDTIRTSIRIWTNFIISQSLMMRLISSTSNELTHTGSGCISSVARQVNVHGRLTLLADQRIVAIIRIVRISCRCTSSVTEDSEVEFWILSQRANFSCPRMDTHERYRETHGQIAQSVRSCIITSAVRPPGKYSIKFILVSNVERIRRRRSCKRSHF